MKKPWTIDSVVAALEQGRATDSEFAAAVRPLGAPLVAALIELAGTGAPRVALNAVSLLLHLGGAEASVAAVEALRGGGDARRTVLATLSAYGPQLSLDAAVLLPALAALLDDADRWDAGLALKAIGHLQAPAAIEVLAARVGAGPLAERVGAAFWLALRGEDRGALDAIDALLAGSPAKRTSRTPDDPRYQATRALELLVEKGDAASRSRAQAIAERFVRARLAATETSEVNHVLNAIRALDGAASQAAVLETVLTEASSSLLRGQALAGLAKLGRASVEALSVALADPELRSAAARALAGVAVDPRLLEAVATALVAEEDEDVCGVLVGVLVAHPAALAEVLPRVEGKLGGWTRMQLRWVAEGIGPARAAKRLADAGVIAPPSARRLKSLETAWKRGHDPHAILELLGEERVDWFDTETSDPVSDHAALCERLASLAGDALPGLEAEQTGGRRDKRYAVRVSTGDHEHRFSVENRGDWYDLVATLGGLDGLLAEVGRPERYFALETGDQTAIVVCAPGAGFREAAVSLGIPITAP